jgi:hypothetical protein
MGAEQVLRAAHRLSASAFVAIAVVALGASAAHADPRRGLPRLAQKANRDGEPIAVVDLRAGDPSALAASRSKLIDDLDKVNGIRVKRELDGALSGSGSDQDVPEVLAAIEEAQAAFGALDCGRATTAANKAIVALAARQAGGLDDRIALRKAWAYVLLCADRADDTASMAIAVSRLRALGATTADQASIDPKVWNRAPEVDAVADREIVEVTIEADATGATAWIDHVAVGTIGSGGLVVYVPAGDHVIAAAVSSRRGAKAVTLAGKQAKVSLALVDRRGKHSDLAGMVKAWRDKVESPTADGLAAVMSHAEVRFAVVLSGNRTAQVWARSDADRVARKLDDSSIDSPLEIGSLIVDKVAVWDGRAPDADYELLTESAEEREQRYGDNDKRRTKWWVYASIAGAALVGGAILYFNETAEDIQRIEINGP